VDEERIQLFCDLLFVGEFERAFERNPKKVSKVGGASLPNNLPDTLQMHGANLDNVPGLLALENTITASAGHPGHVE